MLWILNLSRRIIPTDQAFSLETPSRSSHATLGLGCLAVRSVRRILVKLDDERPESIFHHVGTVGSQSVSYLLSVQCEVLKSSELR